MWFFLTSLIKKLVETGKQVPALAFTANPENWKSLTTAIVACVTLSMSTTCSHET